MDGGTDRRRLAGGRSMAGRDAGGAVPQGEATGEPERPLSASGRVVSEGPLGTVRRGRFGERPALLWELPAGVARGPGSGVAAAARVAADLRGAVRKVLDFRDGTVAMEDSGGPVEERTLEEWGELFGEGGAYETDVFAFVRALGGFFDAQSKRPSPCLPARFVPGRVLVRTETTGEPAFLLDEYAVSDAVRAALRAAGRPTDETAGDAAWRAPESDGGAATPAGVQWTLARMAYGLLAGGAPPRGPYRRIPRLSAGQNAALERALSERPEKRFASCGDFAEALETGRLPNPGGAGRWSRAAAALLLAAGVAAGSWEAARIVRGRAEVPAVPEGGSGEVEAVPTGELPAAAEEALSAARAARAGGRWGEARARAAEVLAAVPGHEEARAIERAAEEAEAPWLRVEADRAGAWIERGGEKTRLPTSIRLERGKKAGPWDVRAEEGGESWSGFIPEFEVGEDWTGERTARVALARGTAGSGAERKRRTVTLPDGKTFAMIWCPPGTFRMGGAGSGEGCEVRLTKGFWLAEREFTVGEWKSLRPRTPSSVAKWNNRRKRPILNDVDARPVDNAPWEDCVAFIGELNASGCDLELSFRLPTEAEWEYACRAGSGEDFDGPPEDEAWFDKTAKPVGDFDKATRVVVSEIVPPQPAGLKKANAWGFLDMHGNVSEWCSDAWEERWWAKQAGAGELVDPKGPAHGEGHVVRGGDVRSPAWKCSSSAREGAPRPRNGFDALLAPLQEGDRRYENIGFRLAADEI